MDKKAKNILFKTYWSSTGWISEDNRKIELEDFDYAKEKGLMFEPVTLSKSELISKLENVIKAVPKKKITDAFLCSLTNKRLDWRSGLASYENAKRLINNKNIDDYFYGHGKNVDINILNFERIKWGGVRHFQGLYNWLDLSQLEKEIIPQPSKEDIEVFKNLLKAIDNSEFSETPSKLRDRLSETFKGSKNERHNLIEILSCSDILKPLRFDRKEPGKHDWDFALHWRGEDKYDRKKVNELFEFYDV